MSRFLAPRLVVARQLGVDPDRIDPDQPLASYGMDSLRSMELVAALEDATGRPLPPSFCFDHPTLNRLSNALGGGHASPVPGNESWRRDAALPEDFTVAPAPPTSRPPRNVLLTGATGLLGGHLLRTLIDDTDVQVWCLVRSAPGRGLARIKANLAQYGIWREGLGRRLDVVRGDLTSPRLGMSTAEYLSVAAMTDAVIHAAADVDWVQPYESLRRANVLGTLEVLRLAAAARPKPVQFISSLSVCYVPDGPPMVDESTDCLRFVDRLPLGYAQTKCVAEALCRQAAARGLPMRIIRPELVAGDSRSGASNPDDLIARLVRGCIEMRAAPDLNWTLDALPVDEIARAVVQSPWPRAGALECTHLSSPRPRTWQDCVLWINLLGYRCQLLPFAEWRAQLVRAAVRPAHPLAPLRPFFAPMNGQDSPAELYQSGRHSAVAASSDTAGGAAPLRGMDASMLADHVDGYVARGLLAPSGKPRASRRAGTPRWQHAEGLEALLRHRFGPAFAVLSVDAVHDQPASGIISDLTTWRRGSETGVFRRRITIEQNGVEMPLPVVIKARAHEEDALDAARALAGLCGDRLADTFERFEDRIGLCGAGNREVAIYDHANERLRRWMPACYATWREDDVSGAGCVLEDLSGDVKMNAADAADWSDAEIHAALEGLADIHAAGLECRADPPLAGALRPLRASADVRAMAPLWDALAAHAAPLVEASAGRGLTSRHRELVRTVDQWTPALEASPLTLIHHDFNPRNAALRRDRGRDVLCAYDWELATVGLPQRDLAEFLLFALPSDVSEERLLACVDGYRRLLSRATARDWHAGDWRDGFSAALSLLLVDRLGFYAMIHRVRHQSFLPRLVRTWQRLDAIASSSAFGRSAR